MTEMGEKLQRITKLLEGPRIDFMLVLSEITGAIMLERQRAIEILEAPMERLHKRAAEGDASAAQAKNLLVELRDRVADASLT